MNRALLAQVVFLAVLGLVVAAGIGLLTNSIAGDSIGLSAAPLSAGRDLAPAEARRGADRREKRRERREERREERRDRRQHRREDAQTTTTAPTTTVPTTTFDDNSGSGSSNSGSGSSGSGSDDFDDD